MLVKLYSLTAPPLYQSPRYIGATRKSLTRRLREHLYFSRNAKRSTHKDNWIRKAEGEGCTITITMIREVPLEEWAAAERELIKKYPDLTNSCAGGPGVINPSKEAREKIGAVHRGKTLSQEHRLKISASGKGRKMSEAAKKKIGDRHRGKTMTQQAIEKIRAAKVGLMASAETKEKMRQAHTGRKHNKETLDKMRLKSTGRRHSAETRQKMSQAAKLRPIYPDRIEKMAAAIRGKPMGIAHREKIRRALRAYHASKNNLPEQGVLL